MDLVRDVPPQRSEVRGQRSGVGRRSTVHARGPRPEVRSRKSDGFSLPEAVISVAILALLLTSVFSITVESISLLGDAEVDYVVQIEGDRALTRIVDILHKTGRMEEKGVAYPRVLADGAEIAFRIPDDLDGDGYPFDHATGEIEWSPHVFSMKKDSDGTLSVYRSGTEVYVIAHHVRYLRFQTVAEDSRLHLREIAVDLEIEKSLDTGHDVVFSLSGSAHMRN